MKLPEQTKYEIESLKRILSGEGQYDSIEAREEVINRLRYSISETVLTMLLGKKCIYS